MEVREVADTAGVLWAIRLAKVIPYAGKNPITVAWDEGANFQIKSVEGTLMGISSGYLRINQLPERKLRLIPLCSITCIAKTWKIEQSGDVLYRRGKI